MAEKIYNRVEIHRKKMKVKPDPSLGAKGEKIDEYPSILRVIIPTKDYRIQERKLI